LFVPLLVAGVVVPEADGFVEACAVDVEDAFVSAVGADAAVDGVDRFACAEFVDGAEGQDERL
jgi:hypothetical protein